MTTLYDDFLDCKNHYYRHKESGIIIHPLMLEASHSGQSTLTASVIKELKAETDKCEGVTRIPLIAYLLSRYERIPDEEIEQLRAQDSQLEQEIQTAQSSPSCRLRGSPFDTKAVIEKGLST